MYVCIDWGNYPRMYINICISVLYSNKKFNSSTKYVGKYSDDYYIDEGNKDNRVIMEIQKKKNSVRKKLNACW